MTKASVLIDDALQMIGVSSHMMPADPAQQQRAFTTLKRLFYSLPARSVYLQMRRPASLTAEMREPQWATDALVAILADAIGPYFPGRQNNPAAAVAYSQGLRMLQRKTRRPTAQSYDSTVPLGSGNYSYGWSSWFYYPGDTNYQYTQYDNRRSGEISRYYFDFTDEAQARNTDVASIAWENVGAERALVSDEQLSGSEASALVEFTRPGSVVIRARCTFTNGEVYDGVLQVSVTSPTAAYHYGD